MLMVVLALGGVGVGVGVGAVVVRGGAFWFVRDVGNGVSFGGVFGGLVGVDGVGIGWFVGASCGCVGGSVG